MMTGLERLLMSADGFNQPEYLLFIESLDIVTASIIVVIMVVFYVAGATYRRTRSSEGWKLSDLEDDEEDIVHLLEDNDGRVEQKMISDSMDWSDAKTSRLTSDLINKNVVEKVREDRQNYVVLKEDSRTQEDS